MTFLDHLEELRRAIFRAVFVVVALVATAWAFSGRLLDGLIAWILPGQKLLALTPTEAFGARVEIALWTGCLVAVPYLFLELWRFVAPGLKPEERGFALPWMVVSALLLYSGLAFSIGVLLPIMIPMLQSFTTPSVESRMALLPFLRFAVKLSAGCGLLFQMPLVVCLLAWFGLVSPSTLARRWRHAVFFIALGAAIVTPGDGPTMVVLAAPLLALYLLSVGVGGVIWRIRGRRSNDPGRFA